jgi:galactonate dehydratase
MPPYLTPSPDAAIKITAIETVTPSNLMGNLMLLRIHTDAGIIGHGETYYGPTAVAALIHDWMSDRLLGSDAIAVESHWRFFYERFGNFGIGGAEMRAISAVDLALWDILGQVCNQPIYRLLGGPVRDQVAVYNSCGNPNYGRSPGGKPGWPGYGSLGAPGPLNDSYQLFHDPVGLAQELLAEGQTGMKVWCFDRAAHQSGGMRISLQDLNHAIKPLQKIREAVGDKLEIMVDGHGFFMLPAALRIAEALREIQPLWLEDILKMDNVEQLADFRQQSRMPISVSEMLLHRPHYQRVLETKGADYVMVDPTWAGGISETVRIAHLAQGYNVPVTMHDCTGPLTLFAGLHVNAAVAGCCYQETVRAHIRSFYKELIDELPVIENGMAALPTRPGLGVKLHDRVFRPEAKGYRITRL